MSSSGTSAQITGLETVVVCAACTVNISDDFNGIADVIRAAAAAQAVIRRKRLFLKCIVIPPDSSLPDLNEIFLYTHLLYVLKSPKSIHKYADFLLLLCYAFLESVNGHEISEQKVVMVSE